MKLCVVAVVILTVVVVLSTVVEIPKIYQKIMHKP